MSKLEKAVEEARRARIHRELVRIDELAKAIVKEGVPGSGIDVLAKEIQFSVVKAAQALGLDLRKGVAKDGPL